MSPTSAGTLEFRLEKVCVVFIGLGLRISRQTAREMHAKEAQGDVAALGVDGEEGIVQLFEKLTTVGVQSILRSLATEAAAFSGDAAGAQKWGLGSPPGGVWKANSKKRYDHGRESSQMRIRSSEGSLGKGWKVAVLSLSSRIAISKSGSVAMATRGRSTDLLDFETQRPRADVWEVNDKQKKRYLYAVCHNPIM